MLAFSQDVTHAIGLFNLIRLVPITDKLNSVSQLLKGKAGANAYELSPPEGPEAILNHSRHFHGLGLQSSLFSGSVYFESPVLTHQL